MENSAILSQILEEAEIDPSAISIFAGIMIVYFAILGVVALALYLLEAFALFNMAKSAGYSRPWRGFIPFANTFLFGKIAEKYRKKDGKPSAKFGGLLLACEIVMLVLSIAVLGFCVKFIIDIINLMWYCVLYGIVFFNRFIMYVIRYIKNTLIIIIIKHTHKNTSYNFHIKYYTIKWTVSIYTNSPVIFILN